MLGVIVVVGIVGVGALLYFIEQQQSAPTPSDSNSNGDSQVANPQADNSQDSETVSQATDSRIQALAQGIARGEGFYASGSLPRRSNNPGDLTKSFGYAISGVANPEGVLIFASANDGWNALYDQLNLIFAGNSQSFSTDMTIEQFASVYTKGKSGYESDPSVQGWVKSVLQELNAGQDSTLSATNTLADIGVQT